MKYNRQLIQETLSKFIKKYRDLPVEQGKIMGYVVLEDKDTVNIQRNNRIVFDFASNKLNFWKIRNDIVNRKGTDDLIINTKDILFRHYRYSFSEDYCGHKIYPDVICQNFGSYGNIDALTKGILKEESCYEFSQIYCFVYIFDKYGGTDEFTYPIHLESAIKELLSTGKVDDVEVFL